MIPAGVEPTTYCLEGSCSIRLSYGIFKIQDSKFRIQDLIFKIQYSEFKILKSKFKIQNSEFKILNRIAKKNEEGLVLTPFILHFFVVGAAGFEPATSWSQTRRDDRTTLRPELHREPLIARCKMNGKLRIIKSEYIQFIRGEGGIRTLGTL